MLLLQKPLWSGGRGDVEHYLRNGYRCFLVRDVPEYALADDVEVVCDDGDCFGCILRPGNKEEIKPKTVDEMVDLGYTCILTR